MGEEAGRIDSGRSEGCWKFFKGSRRGVGRVGMTGLKKCDAFFLIGGGAAVVISQRTWTESSGRGSPSSVVDPLFQTCDCRHTLCFSDEAGFFFFFLPRERFSSRYVTRGSSKRSMDPLHLPNEAIGAPLYPSETTSFGDYIIQ